jgi:8-oxo-dGTP diphosphatase
VSCVLGPVGEFAYRGDDGRDRVEYDFLVRVEGDLRRPRLEPGKHTDWRWIGEADLDVLDEHQVPGNLLIRRIVVAGFAATRALGLTPS